MRGRRIEAVQPDRAGFAAQVSRLVEALNHTGCAGIGIGIPGRVDGGTGAILSAGYLDIAGLDLRARLGATAGLSVRVENDAAMALLAEVSCGPADARGLVAMVTVGTGVGGALVSEGRPWHGGGVAGQFGHIVVDAGGPLCRCGQRGCVETFSSGTALGALVLAEGLAPGTRVEDLLDRAVHGDAVAATVLDRWALPMQRALHTLAAVVNPVRVVIGGGLGGAMAAALERLPARDGWYTQPFSAATLGDDAGVIGAGLSVFAGRAP